MKTRIHRLGCLLLALCMAVSFSAALSACAPTNLGGSVAELREDKITGGWQLARVKDTDGATGQSLSQQYSTGEDWISATVPGTVLTSYMDAGLIEDPYYSDNMRNLDQDYYNVDYWYRTEFTVSEDYRGQRVWLNFDGINHKADVYVNGQEIGKIEGAFIRGKFDVTDVVNVGQTNYLAVYIHWCDSQVEDMPSFLCSAGWDWMPAIPGRNMGIYKDVYLTMSGDVTLEDPFVKTDLPLPALTSASVDISTDVVNHSDRSISGTIKGTIRPKDDAAGEAITFEKAVTIGAGETQNVALDTVTMQNPRLWWPNGYGEQNLYELELSFEAGGVSDIKTTTFGVREITYDSDNHDLQISVNGQKVLCKGGNWGMPDAMLRWTEEDFDTAVKLHKDMNLTMIRTWHGTADFDAFYDACDKYGILVFEDFWLNGWTVPEDTEMFMANVDDKVKRLRNRACIAVWCGENEAVPPAPLNHQIPASVNEYDGTRLYIAASNEDPVSGGVTYAVQEPAWYFSQAAGFTTEIGSTCVPTIESMRRMMKESDLWPVGNDMWQWHDYNAGIGNKATEKYTATVNGRYGQTSNAEEFCEQAQLLNLETFKAMFEAWNDKLWDDCSGVLLWMTSPAWPSTIWQTYDYYWDPTGAYFGVKSASEPVHVQWNSFTGSIKAINNTAEDLKGVTVEAEVYNLDGTRRYQNSVQIDARSNTATEAFKLFAPAGVNVAANKTARSSSQESGEMSASRAFDGNDTTRWASSGTGQEWLMVDLGEPQSIDHVVIQWENAYASRYQIQVSNDGASWTSVASVTDGYGGTATIAFDAVTARYVRLYCQERGTSYAYSVYEMQVIQAGTMDGEVEDLSDTHFIKLRLRDAQGNLLSENFYWRSTADYDYTAMRSMNKASLTAQASTQVDGETTRITLTVRNSDAAVAVAVRLKAIKDQAASGEDDRILPILYSDNYFSLLPGEEKTVTLEFETKYLDGANAQIVVDGYNADSFTVQA